jgi:hypothetical protein
MDFDGNWNRYRTRRSAALATALRERDLHCQEDRRCETRGFEKLLHRDYSYDLAAK